MNKYIITLDDGTEIVTKGIDIPESGTFAAKQKNRSAVLIDISDLEETDDS